MDRGAEAHINRVVDFVLAAYGPPQPARSNKQTELHTCIADPNVATAR